MESTSLLNASLDLNRGPVTVLDAAQPQNQEEDQMGNFIEFGKNLSVQQERGALMEKLNRLNAENKKLAEMVAAMCDSCAVLRKQLMEHTSKNPTRKRKSEAIDGNNVATNGTYASTSGDNEDSSEKCMGQLHVKAKIWRVNVRTDASDSSFIVKDGYHWRKYGQKVTRDNPSPRAYFKCSCAPTCPAKKKVQRSIEDPSILVATYEGEHNHNHPPTPSASQSFLAPANVLRLMPPSSSGPTTIDFTKRKAVGTKEATGIAEAPPEVRQCLVEQMASTLTKDPGFKAALAAAISGRFLQTR